MSKRSWALDPWKYESGEAGHAMWNKKFIAEDKVSNVKGRRRRQLQIILNADFNIKINPDNPLEVTLESTSTVENDIITQHIWTFDELGNNGIFTGNDTNPTFVYPGPGTYTIKLLNNTETGVSDFERKSVTITIPNPPPPPNDPPIVNDIRISMNPDPNNPNAAILTYSYVVSDVDGNLQNITLQLNGPNNSIIIPETTILAGPTEKQTMQRQNATALVGNPVIGGTYTLTVGARDDLNLLAVPGSRTVVYSPTTPPPPPPPTPVAPVISRQSITIDQDGNLRVSFDMTDGDADMTDFEFYIVDGNDNIIYASDSEPNAKPNSTYINVANPATDQFTQVYDNIITSATPSQTFTLEIGVRDSKNLRDNK
jgi:hypothetical protein